VIRDQLSALTLTANVLAFTRRSIYEIERTDLQPQGSATVA
jgi:hypothetical protein